MQYFFTPEVEYHEARGMELLFGKRFTPDAEVSLSPPVVVNGSTTDLLDVGGRVLAIEPDSASWAFLNSREASLFQALQGGKTVQWVRDNWPKDALRPPDEFITALYRRGLVELNGQVAVDRRMFVDSHNTRDKNLVELLLTEKCNLSCGYCLAGAKPGMPTMNLEIGKKAIDLAFQMNEADNISFQFSGGEPFMKFELMKKLVDYVETHPGCAGRRIYMSIQTNGTLLNDENVKWTLDHNIQMGLSIDGLPEAQNAARPFVNGKPSYERAMRGLSLLQKHGVCFGVIAVLSRANIGRADELIDFMIGHGVHAIKLNPIAYIGTGRENWHSLGLHPHEVIEYARAFVEEVAKRKAPINEANVSAMLTHIVSKQRTTRCLRGHCGAGRTFQAINAKGDIHPCGRGTQTPAMNMGNVLTEMRSLSHPAREHPLIQQIEGRRPKTVEGCDVCSFRELCQAGCSVEAFERYGTVRHKTPECDYFMEMYPYLMNRLTHDEAALSHFSKWDYFAQGATAELMQVDFLPADDTALPADLKPTLSVIQRGTPKEPKSAQGHSALPILA